MSLSLKIETNTVQTEIVDALRRMIFANELRAGERLVQDELAARLNVSRTPVREAIRQLESEGLVAIQPYKGATVTKVTSAEIKEIYQVRIAIESHATRLAIENLTQNNIEKLEALVREMHEKVLDNDPEGSLIVNRRFYEYFYNLSGQSRLFDLIVQYLDLAKRFRQQHFYSDSFLYIATEYHEKLMVHIRNRETSKAVNLVSEELQSIADDISERFSNNVSS